MGHRTHALFVVQVQVQGRISWTEQLLREKQSFEATSNGRFRQQAAQLPTTLQRTEKLSPRSNRYAREIYSYICKRRSELRSTVQRRSTSKAFSRGESRGDAPPARTSAFFSQENTASSGLFPRDRLSPRRSRERNEEKQARPPAIATGL